VASCAVKNLKTSGAKACFSSPAAFIKVQERWINTNLSHYFPREIYRKAFRTAYADTAVNRGKLFVAISAQKVRLESANSGSFRLVLA
jgi:hypothetical protein